MKEIGDRLYALPPDQFVAARDEAVAQARRDGDRERAREIGGWRRPTVAAWLVNLLAVHRPEQLAEFLDIGAQLHVAQQSLRGAALRELSGRRRAAVSGLVAQVRELAAQAGRAGENLPLVEVETTLNAALADPEIAELVRGGRLERSATYAGFGEAPGPELHLLTGGATAAGAPERRTPQSTRQIGKAVVRPVRSPAAPPVDTAAAERLTRAQADLDEATAAERSASELLDDLGARLTELRRQHTAAQVAAARAKLRLKAAGRAVDQARRALQLGGG